MIFHARGKILAGIADAPRVGSLIQGYQHPPYRGLPLAIEKLRDITQGINPRTPCQDCLPSSHREANLVLLIEAMECLSHESHHEDACAPKMEVRRSTH